MKLSPEDVDILRSSFRRVAMRGPAAGALFYDRLFATAPDVRQLFTGDMDEQRVKLMSMMGTIVAQLHEHEGLAPIAADLARRHVDYGVEAVHYEKVQAALLWTVARVLGDDFEPPVEAAWTRAIAALSATMIEAAYGRDGTATVASSGVCPPAG
ncbi:MAG: globin domain-containing protein [Pseudomonadota bacterium]